MNPEGYPWQQTKSVSRRHETEVEKFCTKPVLEVLQIENIVIHQF